MKRTKIALAALLTAALSLTLALRLPARATGESVALPIVMYHHVSEKPGNWNDYVVSPAELESDLCWLRDHGYTAVGVAELLAWADGRGEVPEKPCMITFDDGFESTMTLAEPLLAEYGFCGVVAVIGSVCEKFSGLDDHYEYSNLSWEEARDMASRGIIEVQCHTWDLHAQSPRRGCAPLRWEDRESYQALLARDLSRWLDAAASRSVGFVPAIAYPYGAYTDATEQTVRALGFRAAFTCTEQINRLTGDADELFDLGRFNRPHGVSSENFFRTWEENA